jgi:alpha-ribazole phosphatase/probable phosphoglycerate mutase
MAGGHSRRHGQIPSPDPVFFIDVCQRSRDIQMTRLYLVRHGQVANHRPQSYNGQRDVPLSDVGRLQMARLADWAAELDGPVVIYTSDLQRAADGARLAAARRGIEATVTPLLREKHFGAWEGLTYDEAAQRDPDVWRQWLDDPPNARPPGGETYRDVEARVMPLVRRWVREHAGQTVLIVAHGGVNRVILCHALGLPLRRVFRIEQDYAALNCIDEADGRLTVRWLNAVLPG